MTPNERQDEEIKALTKERDDWHSVASSHLLALCEKQAEVNALTLIWTNEKPSTPGWYWWRSFEKHMEASERIVQIVEFPNEPQHYWKVTGPGIHWLLGNTPGEWAGPIPEPEDGAVTG